jgi:hypothetical protein
MLTRFLAIVFILNVSGVLAHAESTVSTTPVGVVTIELPVGNTIVAPAFVNPIELASTIEASTSSGNEVVIELPAGTNLQAGVFNESPAPRATPRFFLEITGNGPNAGSYFDIVSNSATSITIFWPSTNGPPDFSQGDSFAVRQHMTLGQFFRNADGLPALEITLKFFYRGGSETFVWTGSFWRDRDSQAADDLPIYPGQAFLFTNSGTGAVSFPAVGTVKDTPTLTPVYVQGAINLVNPMLPTDGTIAQLDPLNWMEAFDDGIKIFSSDGSLSTEATVISSGSELRGGDQNQPLRAFEGFLFIAGSEKNIPMPVAYGNASPPR